MFADRIPGPDGARAACENARAMADARRRPNSDPSRARPAAAAASSSTWRTCSTTRPAGGPGVFRRALRREASRLRDPRRIVADRAAQPHFSLLAAGHDRPRRGRPAPTPGRTGPASGSGSTAATRTTRPGRSCRTSTRRGCCRCSRRGRSCRGTSPGSCGAVGTILLLLWTIHWAYRRRPLTTAVIVALLAFPFGANLDTGNINLQLTLMLWAAQFTGPRLGGLLWALATWMKWIPAILWPILAAGDATLGPALAGAVDRAQHRSCCR